LLDFGIAVRASASLASAGKTVGTPAYMSPEQVLGRELDGRSDLYSLGILAYVLCTGTAPWNVATHQDLLTAHILAPMPDPRLLAPDLPEDLAAFIDQATRKQREDRFASCADAAAFLRGGELPIARLGGLATLVVQFAPESAPQVQALLAEFGQRLRQMPGVRVLEAQDQPGRGASIEAPGLVVADATVEMGIGKA